MNSKTKTKIVFIDRDGVINEDLIGDYIKTWKDFRFIPGAIAALKQLSENGYGIVIISNQAGIGDGVFHKKDLDILTESMMAHLKKEGAPIKRVYYCLHGKEEGCSCRKPRVGLFEQAKRDFDFDPAQTYFIGDKLSDMQAGESFGLKTLFVLTGHGQLDRAKLKGAAHPEKILPSIKEAAQYLVSLS